MQKTYCTSRKWIYKIYLGELRYVHFVDWVTFKDHAVHAICCDCGMDFDPITIEGKPIIVSIERLEVLKLEKDQ
jgi:hypothetical protein